MLTEDYLIRMIALAVAALARLAGLKAAGNYKQAQQEIDQALQGLTGLPPHLLNTMDEQGLVALLSGQSPYDARRLLLAAELFKEQGEVRESLNDSPGSTISYLRSLVLSLEAAQSNGGAEAAQHIGRILAVLPRLENVPLSEETLFSLYITFEQTGQLARAETALYRLIASAGPQALQEEIAGFYRRIAGKEEEENNLPLSRSDFTKAKRRLGRLRMDTLFAPIYDQQWGATINSTHRRFVERLIDLTPAGGEILDAACGTGKYWPMLIEAGFKITGFDQSPGILGRARQRFPQVRIETGGLQELDTHNRFDAIMCVDAMELVSPEDWPVVLANFYQALRSGSFLYFTVELTDPGEQEKAYTQARALGLPVVEGEAAEGPGYHYYPALAQVRDWVQQAGFTMIEETEGDGYQHYLAQKKRDFGAKGNI